MYENYQVLASSRPTTNHRTLCVQSSSSSQATLCSPADVTWWEILFCYFLHRQLWNPVSSPDIIFVATTTPTSGYMFLIRYLYSIFSAALRAVPEIILGGVGHIFFQTPPPPHTWESEPPDPQESSVNQTPPRTCKCFNYPHPTMDQICLDPQDKLTTPPHPLDTSRKHPPPTGQICACGPPPPLRIISGTEQPLILLISNL